MSELKLRVPAGVFGQSEESSFSFKPLEAPRLPATEPERYVCPQCFGRDPLCPLRDVYEARRG